MYSEPKQKTVEEVVALAGHFIATGQTVWRMGHVGDSDERPWALVVECENAAGGWSTTEYGVRPDIRFRAEHPCGLTFTWDESFCTYDRSTFGPVGGLSLQKHHVDIARLHATIALLPEAVHQQFRDAIREAVANTRKQVAPAEEMIAFVKRETAVLESAVATL